MYKYSMTQWIVGNEDIEYSFQRLKKNGYDGIEFAAEPYTIDQERMVSLLKKYEMECTSLYLSRRKRSDIQRSGVCKYSDPIY